MAIEFEDIGSTAPDDLEWIGSLVKVGFKVDTGVEWMWVEVLERLGDGSFRGKLMNDPEHLRGVGFEDEVEGFRLTHILDVRPR